MTITLTSSWQFAIVWLFISTSYACNKTDGDPSGEQTGYVKGKVTDTQGRPLPGVKIIIDNTIIYNTYITTSTDDNGNYRAKLSTGSWLAYAQHRVNYNGKTYSLYLDPDNTDGFSIDGGVCNFQWKLSGAKKEPLKGTYGGTILLTRGIGSTLFDNRNIEYTLTPLGTLIDGSQGEVLIEREAEDYPKLADIPIGRYRLTAVYRSAQGDIPLQLMDHYNRAAGYASSLVIDFLPSSPDGDNMASIEYHE